MRNWQCGSEAGGLIPIIGPPSPCRASGSDAAHNRCVLFVLRIAAKIDPNEPSAVSAPTDLANLRATRVFSLTRKERHTSCTQAGLRNTYSWVGLNTDG